jgi:signal transduction histidine kinase
VDITIGREAILTLQQVNHGLDKMFRSKASQLSKALDKVDRDHLRMARMDERLRLLSSRLILAQEQERERISSDLHDGLGQRLSLARYTIERCLDKLVSEGGAECTVTSLRTALDYVKESVCEIRNVVQGLKPSMLEELGVIASLELLVHEFELTYTGIRFNAEIEPSDTPVSYDVSVAIYRISQEALRNIVKHADASNVDFSVDISSRRTRLRVADNGRGIDCSSLDKSVPGKTGHGLANIRERATATGGRFEIDSDADSGTSLTVVWQNDLT